MELPEEVAKKLRRRGAAAAGEIPRPKIPFTEEVKG